VLACAVAVAVAVAAAVAAAAVAVGVVVVGQAVWSALRLPSTWLPLRIPLGAFLC
jgi:hypothetical protein